MDVRYLKSSLYMQSLRSLADCSADTIIVAASPILETDGRESLEPALEHCARILKPTGLLFVQGTPWNLPETILPLMRSLQFKYWIVLESTVHASPSRLPTAHAALVLFSKSAKSFAINKIRFPHRHCPFCTRTVKDWGGKSHLMNPAGYAISDVWRDLPKQDNYTKLSLPVLQMVLRLADSGNGTCLVFPYEGVDFDGGERVPPASPLYSPLLPPLPQAPRLHPPLSSQAEINKIDDALLDLVHWGDIVEILRQYPDNSVDLAFADPPYNLAKAYNHYRDRESQERYLLWCNLWLTEYIRVLKPTGSLYVINLPKWAIHHAAFLNQRLHLQNWIAWDAIPEPRGKIMPAHYALLFYTRHPTDFTFNYDDVSPIDAPCFCLRPSCVRDRKQQGIDPKVPLTDIWGDIHRIKHKRDRDLHPCQLPERLMERVIRLSSNKGDIVLDALCGAGTTAVAAYKLGRRFIAVDVDKRYAEMTRAKIKHLATWGIVPRESEVRRRPEITNKELQLELRNLAETLGRLPTKQDVQRLSKYDIELFEKAFRTWGKALKAAKLRVPSGQG